MKRKSKVGKKPKASTKRKASVSSDEDQVSVAGSLPPAVEGQLRCFLRVTVGKITWAVPHYPDNVQVRVRWWGEEEVGALLRPVDVKGGRMVNVSTKWSSARYPVCSGPKQFAAYLKDMGTLILDVVHGPSLDHLGRVMISEIVQLTASHPVHGFFPVMSVGSPSNKIAELYVSIKFETVSAAFNRLSSAMIPTVDTGLDQENIHVDTSDPHPTPPPYVNPATPVAHPRYQRTATDPFASPASLPSVKGVKFSQDPPQRLEYTIDPSVISLLEDEMDQEYQSGPTNRQNEDGNTRTADTDIQEHTSSPGTQGLHMRSATTQLTSDNQTDNPGQIGDGMDWIGALLDRGQKLREGMALTALLGDDNDLSGYVDEGDIPPDRHVLPGQLFKEILSKGKPSHHAVLSGPLDQTLDHDVDHISGTEDKVIDLLIGDHDRRYLHGSPDLSDESDEMSEIGDPLYDESLLVDLFYTTPAIKASDSDTDHSLSNDDDDDDLDGDLTISMEDDGNMRPRRKHVSPQDIAVRRAKKHRDRKMKVKHVTKNSKTKDGREKEEETSMEYLDPTTEPEKIDEDSTSTVTGVSTAGSMMAPDLVDRLGADTLTTLGRVNTARVLIDSLELSNVELMKRDVKGKKPSTFLVEYHFPVVASTNDQARGVAMATEVTRVASKKRQDGAVLFNHRSVFPVFFNASAVDQWWTLALTFRVFQRESGHRQPTELGVGVLPLKAILQSRTLSHTANVNVEHKTASRITSDEGSSTVSTSTQPTPSTSSYQAGSDSDSPHRARKTSVIGALQVKVELGVDGKEVHVTPSSISSSTSSVIQPQPGPPIVTMVSRPVVIAGSQSTQHLRGTTGSVTAKPPLPRPVEQPAHRYDNSPSEVHTLYSLLWIPEGKGVTAEAHSIHGNQMSVPGITGRTNPYLVCRMFWYEDVSKSAIYWGTNEPQFGFKQVAPLLLTPNLLQRTCNNFIIVEVWDKSVPQGDKLIGIVKLPLHQFYLSYRDPKITKTLMKSKYPVVCVDEWSAISSPFTASHHGQLKVLLAMGTEEQISSLLTMKGGDEVPRHDRPLHHLDDHRDASQGRPSQVSKSSGLVEHQFEVVVEDIRGLSVFRSTVWGETDCFVQYHFPQQQQGRTEGDDEAVPALKAHRSTTTLCVPDPSFQDIARHSFVLPSGVPVQRYLLAAYSGSWTGAPCFPGMGGIPFELWRRYYYPNVRDQLVAKASLPVAKLCAMVTMQKHREPSVQAFSLPLVVLPGDDQATRQTMVQDTGLLNVSIKYRLSRLHTQDTVEGDTREGQVCLSVDVIRACGLKEAAIVQCSTNQAMAYPSDVGVNVYVVIRLPVGRKSRYTTRTLARTFSPEFSHHIEVLVPLTTPRKTPSPDGTGQEGPLCLAERLETTEAILEVWHKMSRGPGDGEDLDEGQLGSKQDVLLGVVCVPLVQLLTRRAGIRGWHVILPAEERDSSHYARRGNKPLGGLQIAIKFAEPGDRDAVVHDGRGAGWCPPPGVESDVEEHHLWGTGDDETGSQAAPGKGVELRVKISRAWIPVSLARNFAGQYTTKLEDLLGYVRYKLYDKSPICSRLAKVKQVDQENSSCDVKHSRSFIVPASTSLAWYLREEYLEVQVWLGGKPGHSNDSTLPGRRDRLLGSALIDLSTLVNPGKQQTQISGTFPLFKTGASHLDGASVHVQISLTKTNGASTHYDGQEQNREVDDGISSDEYPSTERERSHNESTSPRSSTEPLGTPHGHKERIPSTPPRSTSDEDKDTFAAHVVIQEARHLPVISGSSGERLAPNVYVSYQPTTASAPVCTPIIKVSSNPVWEYQKLERLKLSTLKSQNLVFKVWHRPDVKANGELPKLSRATDEANGSGLPMGDRALGFASMDLAPLAAGLRELIGWYNIMNFSGECKGQIKVGVVPLTPVSPSRCLSTKSRLIFSPPKMDVMQRFSSDPIIGGEHTSSPFAYDTFYVNPGNQTTQEVQGHLVDRLSSQMQVHVDNLRRLRSTGVTQNTSDDGSLGADGVAINTSCSTSFLFSQLRQNMKDLDDLKKGLQAKLRPESDHNLPQTTFYRERNTNSHEQIPTNLKSQHDLTSHAWKTLPDDGSSHEVSSNEVFLPKKDKSPKDSGKWGDIDDPSDDFESNSVPSNRIGHDVGRGQHGTCPAREHGHESVELTEVWASHKVNIDGSVVCNDQKPSTVPSQCEHDAPDSLMSKEPTAFSADDDGIIASSRHHHHHKAVYHMPADQRLDGELDVRQTKDHMKEKSTESASDGEALDVSHSKGSSSDLEVHSDSLAVSGYQGFNVGQRFMEEIDSWLSSGEDNEPESKIPLSARDVPKLDTVLLSKGKREDRVNGRVQVSGIDESTKDNEILHGNNYEKSGDSEIEDVMKMFSHVGHGDISHSEDETSPIVNLSEKRQPGPLSDDDDSDHHSNSGSSEDGNHGDDDSDDDDDNQGDKHLHDKVNSHGSRGVVSALPNFFMPTQQLEQSMRALRLDAKLGQPQALLPMDSQPHSKLLARAYLDENLGTKVRTEKDSEGIALQFACRKLKYKAQRHEYPPISSLEADRIARIFSSKGV